MKRLFYSIAALSLFTCLFLGKSQATCLAPLALQAPGGYPYEVSYATGPNNSCVTYYLDKSGNVAMWGNETVQGNQTANGLSIFTPQVIVGVSSQTTIVPTSTYIQLASTGGVVTLGGPWLGGAQTYYAPISTVTAVAGEMIILYSTSTNSVTISTGAVNGTVGSSNALSGATPKILEFIFDATQSLWREMHD